MMSNLRSGSTVTVDVVRHQDASSSSDCSGQGYHRGSLDQQASHARAPSSGESLTRGA
jgi:hypothetical protein